MLLASRQCSDVTSPKHALAHAKGNELDRRLSERHADVPSNPLDQIAVCGTGEDF
jgi:hypothetical protein